MTRSVRLIGWSVCHNLCHNFPKGREVPCRSTCYLIAEEHFTFSFENKSITAIFINKIRCIIFIEDTEDVITKLYLVMEESESVSMELSLKVTASVFETGRTIISNL